MYQKILVPLDGLSQAEGLLPNGRFDNRPICVT
jgi:hypothetical protein